MKLCKECELNERAPGRSRCYPCYGKARRGEAKPNYTAPTNLKMLFIDIETRPNLGYFWGLFKQNIGINQIEVPCEMLCFVAKWYGDDETMFFRANGEQRQEMIQAAWTLLNEADVVVHFYGSEFDIKHLNREFLLNGFPPPKPFKQIDLKKVVSKRFNFTSNKLQFVSTQLGLAGKEDTDFDLWKGCMYGDEEAWARMESYNRQDVLLLEDVYEILLPWIENHPSRFLYEECQGCPTCGAGTLEDAGLAYTRVSKFRQYRCGSCGSYFRDSRRIEGVTVQESSLN